MIPQIKKDLQGYLPKPMGQKMVYAVLLPLVEGRLGWEILYQIRANHISQPGEVAFPGGRVELGESPADAALRETMEELNLNEDQIDILGEIDFIVQGARTIHCFVGHLKIQDWREIVPNEEVDRVFTLAVKDLQAQHPRYYRLVASYNLAEDFPFDRLCQGRNYPFIHSERRIPFYENLQENLWGLTAQFTHRFLQLIEDKA